MTRTPLIVGAGISLFALLVALAVASQPQQLPAFEPMDTAERKAAFFAFLQPLVTEENRRITEQRTWLLAQGHAAQRGFFAERRFRRLAARYAVPDALTPDARYRELLKRVAPVPEALVLAQAAKESGWGRSRFAQAGNALFGEWCFTTGCGIVPGARRAGASHEVRAFASVAESVASYLHNLNTHDRYATLRDTRARLMAAGEPVTGRQLAPHLSAYSERGDAYVGEIVQMISHNGLE